MLYEPAAVVAMDVRGVARMIACAIVLLISVQESESAARAAGSVEPGRRCLGSQSAIKDNLPLGATSYATEIDRIEAILLPAAHRSAGWLYRTRNGKYIGQIGSPEYMAEAFRDSGDEVTAGQIVASKTDSYVPIVAASVAALRRTPSSKVLLVSCRGAGA